MNKIHLMMVLHAYQPPYPVQEKWVLKRILENCYRPIMSRLEEFPSIKIVLNINASLVDMLIEEGKDVLEKISQGNKRGQIEFLQTGAYHPILPLITSEEIDIQIKNNQSINEIIIGDGFKPNGFFPSELAVDQKTIEYLVEKGYEYVIAPQNSIDQQFDDVLPYLEKDSKRIYVVTRDKNLSNSVAFKSYGTDVNKTIDAFRNESTNRQKPIVLAMDIETFGEHHENYWSFMLDFLSSPSVEMLHFDELKKHSELRQIKRIRSSSWSTDDEEQNNGISFPLWDNPLNPIHSIQHTHFRLVQNLLGGGHTSLDEFSEETQKTILASMHSCQFWWASGNGRWSPSMITKGFKIQQLAIKKILEERGDHDENILDLSNRLYQRLTRAIELRSK